MQKNKMKFINEEKAKDIFNLITINEMREMTFERFKSGLHSYMSGEDFLELYKKSISHKKTNWFENKPIHFRYLYYFITGGIVGYLLSLI